MNNLKEIAESCGITSFSEDEKLQKFANLIVKHCCEIATFVEYEGLPDVSEAIEEYFKL